MSPVGAAVVFDFDGSLRLARRLWATADDLDAVTRDRQRMAEAALVDWSGAHAEVFALRMDEEAVTTGRLTVQLRGEAEGWADEWRKAIDQENRNRHAAAVRRVESQRGFLDGLVGWIAGHDDLPPEPRAAVRPLAPAFLPTRSFADYSRY